MLHETELAEFLYISQTKNPDRKVGIFCHHEKPLLSKIVLNKFHQLFLIRLVYKQIGEGEIVIHVVAISERVFHILHTFVVESKFRGNTSDLFSGEGLLGDGNSFQIVETGVVERLLRNLG